MESCNQVGNIADLAAKVTSLDKDINGNGRKGIKEIVYRLDENLNSVLKTVARIESNQEETKSIFEKKIADLEKAQTIRYTEEDTRVKIATQRAIHNRWLIGIVITLVIFVAGLLFNTAKQKSKLEKLEKTEQTTSKLESNIK